jgi:hypothetical protein
MNKQYTFFYSEKVACYKFWSDWKKKKRSQRENPPSFLFSKCFKNWSWSWLKLKKSSSNMPGIERTRTACIYKLCAMTNWNYYIKIISWTLNQLTRAYDSDSTTPPPSERQEAAVCEVSAVLQGCLLQQHKHLATAGEYVLPSPAETCKIILCSETMKSQFSIPMFSKYFSGPRQNPI